MSGFREIQLAGAYARHPGGGYVRTIMVSIDTTWSSAVFVAHDAIQCDSMRFDLVRFGAIMACRT
jgi:hypothetical protein